MMDDLYHLADILFLPSRDEGFGLPILEAAVDRLPIVCAGLPALREIAGGAATYIEPDDEPVGIARMILERLEADPLGRFAREIRSNYSWEAVYRERIAPLLAPA
jgi:glycosyltransferase involved in cell wall biosynthesis